MKTTLHMMVASTAALALVASSTFARIESVQEEYEPVLVCDMNDSDKIDERIVDVCKDEDTDGARVSSGSGNLGIVIGGLLVAGLAAAGGGGGGDDPPAPNLDPPSNPEPAPNPNPPSNPEPAPNSNPDPSVTDPLPDSEIPFVPTPLEQETPDTPDVENPGSGNIPKIPDTETPDQTTVPDDWRTPEFKRQYGLGKIKVEHRYVDGATGKGTLGVIYDTGIDSNHEDVVNRLDVSNSYSYGSNPSDIEDTHGHGTFMFGIIGAARNGKHIHGVAPDAKFMILKRPEDKSDGNYFTHFSDALKRATDAGADAMNNSWVVITNKSPAEQLAAGGPELRKQLLRSAEEGVSVIFPTGNKTRKEPNVMARLPIALPNDDGSVSKLDNWIAVTALDKDRTDVLLLESNECGTAKDWCLAAPGDRITSLSKDGGIATGSGTSGAAAHVTGAVLVLKSRHPEAITKDIHNLLFDTATDLGDPGVDEKFGRGALNLEKAMLPQGEPKVQMGDAVDQRTVDLQFSWIAESAITGGVFSAAMSDRHVLITDRYDRGFMANLGHRVTTGSVFDSPEMHAGLTAAFSRTKRSRPDLSDAGLDLRFDAFGTGHDVTRIAHVDPVMALVGQTTGTGISMDVPVGKVTLSMSQATAIEGNALSLGASLPFGDDHVISVSVGRAQEIDRILGARAYGAFAGLNSKTVYGRVNADLVLGKRVTLNGSVTAGQTSFRSNGLITNGRMNARAMALGLTITDALTAGDKLSIALAQPFAVLGGRMTIRGGTGISASVNGRRTNRVSFVETTMPLGEADRAPELHLGYLHSLETKRWDSVDLTFGGVARLDGGAKMAVARVALNFRF